MLQLFKRKRIMQTFILIFLLLSLFLSLYWVWKLQKALEKNKHKNTEQQLLLIREERLSEMGAMMGNIAHQWKQPLNIIGLLVLNIQNAHRKNLLSHEKVFDTESY